MDSRTGLFGGSQQANALQAGLGQTVGLDIFATECKGFFREGGQWICYRRNYFTLSLKVSLLSMQGPGISKLYVGDQSQVRTFRLALSAMLEDGQAVPLVQFTPKRTNGPTSPPSSSPLAFEYGHASVHLRRLQFARSTPANNNRTKSKVYYRLKVQILAYCDDGTSVCAAESLSSPILVRGRGKSYFSRPKSDSPESDPADQVANRA